MHIPPECQGQIVEVSYGDGCDGTVYRRTLDHSDSTEMWERAEYAALFPDCACVGDGCPHWSPWNTRPGGFEDAWESCAEPKEDLA